MQPDNPDYILLTTFLKDQSGNVGDALITESFIDLLKSEKDKLTKDCAKLSKLVREQSEADLLINALKAVGIIEEKEEKQPDHFSERDRLQRQMSLARQAGIQNIPTGSLGQHLGALGQMLIYR